MIDPDRRPNEVVHFAWFFMHPQVGPHYSTPSVCRPATPDGCLREIADGGRFSARAGLFKFDGVWFDIELIPRAEATPSHDYYDAFAPIAHPATGNLMAILLRVRESLPKP